MTSPEKTGFLVVLVDAGELCAENPKYAGVDRLPPFNVEPYSTHFPEETGPLEDYVFGDYKDCESGLIPSYDKALDLWKRFGVSRRAYEILFCCAGPDNPALERIDPVSAAAIPLGYDVAGLGGDCCSIVGDFTIREWARPYVPALNNFGLFPSRDVAEKYLADYREHREGDWDSHFDVTFASRVTPKLANPV